MSDVLELLKSKIEAETPTLTSAVGHTPPFTGNLETIIHCAKTAYERIAAKDFKSETLHTHVAQGYGEAAVMALSDDPQPVGAGLPGWLQIFLQLVLLIGENQ